MTPVLAALLLIAVVGGPFASLVGPFPRRRTSIALGFLFGCVVVATILLSLTLLSIRWSRTSVLLPLFIMLALAIVFTHSARVAHETPAQSGQPAGPWPRIFDCGTLLVLLGYFLYATATAPWNWDFWAIWGLKGRAFWETRGIDWSFLTRPDNSFVQPAYPPLIPLLFDFIATLAGRWTDRYLGLLNFAFGVALLVIVRDFLDEEIGPFYAALSTLGLTTCCLTDWIGLAEGGFISLSMTGLLLMRRALAARSRRLLLASAVLLGFAAVTKQEGISLIIATGLALLTTPWGRTLPVIRDFTLSAIPSVTWAIIGLVHHLSNDVFFAADAGRRFVTHLHHPESLLQPMLADGDARLSLWVLAAVAFALAGPRFVRSERFLLIALPCQVAFFIGAYLISTMDLAWHIATSWGRVTEQVNAPLLYLACVALATTLGQEKLTDAGSAETISLSDR
ncbi:MAG TPA: hypothetical protein VHL58_13915 [Thermoanaerobaculia bacterium]|nr:hypothetical protein [Thermoanaerobaculia bacterium]